MYMQFLVIEYGFSKQKINLMYVVIFLCIRTIIITSEIPTVGNHAGRYSPVGWPPKELYGFPGRPEHGYL